MQWAARWLPVLFAAAMTASFAHGQTTGLVAPMAGDCSVDAAGQMTCIATNGRAFAASAITDATNASNITSGTLSRKVFDALPNWRAALAGVKAGTGQARFCVVGDSTTLGTGSTGSVAASGQNYTPYAWPAQMAGILQSSGVPASWDSFFGAGYNSTTFGNSDSRLSVGNSWSQDTASLSLGGYTWKATTATNTLNFTPTGAVDTFRVFFVQKSTAGIAAITVDSGTAQTFLTSGSDGVAVFTVSGLSVGTHTVKIGWSSGGQVNLIGVEGYDSTSHKVILELAGASGIRTTETASMAQAAGGGNSAVYAAIGCNLTSNMLGINDYDTGVSLSDYKTNLQTMVTAQKAAGSDVMLESPVPSNPASQGVTVATQTSYTEGMRAIAAANTNVTGSALTLPFVDTFNTWRSYAYASGLNMYADTFTHPNAGGYYNIAAQMAKNVVGGDISSVPPNPLVVRSDNAGHYGFGGPANHSSKAPYVFYGATGQADGPLTIINNQAGGYGSFTVGVSDYSYSFGTAGASETLFGMNHKAVLFDVTRSKIVWGCDSTGQCAFGYNSGGNQGTGNYPHPFCVGSLCQLWSDASGNVTATQVTAPVNGQAAAPMGTCSVAGQWVFSQDGHATFCPSAGGSWTTKI